jgi:MinD superfamily P-loop ATPase
MKEIVVISGKGGTGKTSITASFAVLGGTDVIVADCDVDAADMHLLLEPDFGAEETFFSGELAVIDQDLCSGCGRCFEVCRYDAILVDNGRYSVDEIGCEGCGYCARVCPDQAITNVEQNVGSWYLSRIRTGSKMVHARLGIGADNSGKLVARVKNEARKIAGETGREIILVDGSPGVGCPVVSSLSGAALAVLVTEPTLSGLHDLKRVHELVKKFDIKAGCIINKADLNADVLRDLHSFLDREGIVNLAEIPYDEVFTAAITGGRTVVEWDDSIKEILSGCWVAIKGLVGVV